MHLSIINVENIQFNLVGLFIYILPNQKKSFGKSQSDIKLEGDAIVSEFHAVISVESTKEFDVNLFLLICFNISYSKKYHQ